MTRQFMAATPASRAKNAQVKKSDIFFIKKKPQDNSSCGRFVSNPTPGFLVLQEIILKNQNITVNLYGKRGIRLTRPSLLLARSRPPALAAAPLMVALPLRALAPFRIPLIE